MKQFLAQRSFAVKFALPAFVSLLAMILIGGVFWSQMNRFSGIVAHDFGMAVQTITKVVDKDFKTALELAHIANNIQALNGSFYRILLNPTEAKAAGLTYEGLRTESRATLEGIDRLLADNTLLPDEAEKLTSLSQALRTNYVGTQQDGIFDVAEQMGEIDIQVVLDGLKSYHETYAGILSLISNITASALTRASSEAANVKESGQITEKEIVSSRNESLLYFTVSFLAFVLITAGVAWTISHHTTLSVRQIADTTEKLAAGNIDIDIESLSRGDELRAIVQALGVFRDNLISLQKSQEVQKIFIEELTRTREEALAANRAKSNFLANMSHELRTPLNNIMGMISLVTRELPNDSEHRQMLSTARHSGQILVQLMSDILDLTKIEVDKFVLTTAVFNLYDTIRQTLTAQYYIAQEKGLSYSCDFVKDDKPYVVGDPVRFSQVLTNIATNALKFTERGSIRVISDWEVTPKGELLVTVSCADTGIGISEENQRRIFEKFFQAEASIKRQYGGAGLGLTIIQQLLIAMEGTISVTSELGKGSTFTISIPFHLATSEQIAELTHTDMVTIHTLDDIESKRIHVSKARILVAEDHPMNKLFMQNYLKKFGFSNFLICENGKEAVDALEDDPHGFDLILMDCHMPVMNGYEAAETIRAREEKTGGHIPIIAVTADAMAGTKEKCKASGMDDYISKPIDLTEIGKVMGRWIDYSGT